MFFVLQDSFVQTEHKLLTHSETTPRFALTHASLERIVFQAPDTIRLRLQLQDTHRAAQLGSSAKPLLLLLLVADFVQKASCVLPELPFRSLHLGESLQSKMVLFSRAIVSLDIMLQRLRPSSATRVRQEPTAKTTTKPLLNCAHRVFIDPFLTQRALHAQDAHRVRGVSSGNFETRLSVFLARLELSAQSME